MMVDQKPSYDYHRSNNRNSLLHNKGVLFQTLAYEYMLVKAMRHVDVDLENARLLDVGCASGGGVLPFLQMGVKAENIQGIDIDPQMIEKALSRMPCVKFECQDATQLSFDENVFDLVYESTAFFQITNDTILQKIADEMVRVSKDYILIIDWRYHNPFNRHYDAQAVTLDKVKTFFKVGTKTELVHVERGALLPPLGRFLSKYLPFFYFPVRMLFPFLAAQHAVVLKKIS